MIHQQRRCASQIWQRRVMMHSSKSQLFIRWFKRGSSATESVWNCYIVLHCSRFMHTCTSCAWTELGMAGPGYRANCCLTTVASPCKAVLGIKCQVTPPTPWLDACDLHKVQSDDLNPGHQARKMLMQIRVDTLFSLTDWGEVELFKPLTKIIWVDNPLWAAMRWQTLNLRLNHINYPVL